jgi:Mitochondrial carrier protein
MVITDRIMSGQYSNFFDAVVNIARLEGWIGFFVGWLPAMMQKIPSYALTWMFIQQLKLAFLSLYARAGTGLENTLIGGLASAAACAIMIPIDTIKTRIVTQPSGRGIAPTYSGIVDCAVKVNCTQQDYRFPSALFIDSRFLC